MSAMSTAKRFILVPAWILILATVVLGVVQSGKPNNLIDPAGFFFVLVGGIALVMISFPGTEILRALRDAVATSGNEADISSSAHFWEAAGRSFWIMGVLRSILHLVMFFISMNTVEVAGIQWLIREWAQYLLATLYGILLAVICFIPCWKLMGRRQSRRLEAAAEQKQISSERRGLRFGAVVGYVLFFAVLVLCFLKIHISAGVLIALKPAVFVVLGGAIALMLLTRGTCSGPTPSTAFAAMGLIGCLLGTIQMLFGMAEGTPGISQVAGAFAFLISSSLTALLGMALVGAPLEDRAIRLGQTEAPPARNRVAWYVFPLLALIFLVPMVLQLFVPLAGPK